MSRTPSTPHATPLWKDGWYQFSGHLPSPNFGPRPEGTTVSLVVIHSISLPPGQFGGTQVQQLFTNQLDWDAHPYFKSLEGLHVSAHFYIRRQGELQQFVSCHDRAWHAGTSSHLGRSNCNDFSVGIELEGLEGSPFEVRQYETLESLCAALVQHFPIAHIAGHEHLAPGRKSDPGAAFDWPLMQRSLGLSGKFFPKPAATKK